MIGCSQRDENSRGPGHFLHLRISHIAIPRLLGPTDSFFLGGGEIWLEVGGKKKPRNW